MKLTCFSVVVRFEYLVASVGDSLCGKLRSGSLMYDGADAEGFGSRRKCSALFRVTHFINNYCNA